MTLNNNLSIIVQPSLGQAPNQISTGTQSGSGLTYDLSSLDIVSSVPLDQQITVTAGGTVLTPGTDYYSDGHGNIVIDSSYATAGTTIEFSRNINLETFYDDFSDLGAAPSGPAKRRDEQILYALQDVEERVSNFEAGDIEVDLDETRIVASNTTFGPGDIGFFDNNGILITSEANGTGIGFAINYAEALSNPLLIDGVESLVASYLTENPVTAPVDSVAGKTGAVTLVAADLGDFNSAVDARIPAIPTAVSSLDNDAGYVTGSVVLPTSQITGLDNELTKLPPAGGNTGQVLKKTSDSDYAFTWADDIGGTGPGGEISFLNEIGNVNVTNVVDGDLLYWNSTDSQWQNFSQNLTSDDIGDFLPAVTGILTDNLNVSIFTNDADYATNAEVTTAVNGITYSSLNGPTLLSQFTNDEDFQTESEVSTAVSDGVAGKFNEPTGSPSTGDIIEWSGSEAQWVAPSTGGGASFWQIVDNPEAYGTASGNRFNQETDFSTATELSLNSPGTFTVGAGDIPTFTFSSAGTYKVHVHAKMISDNTTSDEHVVDLKKNGTIIWRTGGREDGVFLFHASNSYGFTIFVEVEANDVLTIVKKSGSTDAFFLGMLWNIEKVG